VSKKLIILLLSSLFFVGCSTKVSYFFLDWAIEWEVEEYVELTSEQQDKFDIIIESFLVWHRQQELPRYRDQLSLLSTLTNQQTMTPELWLNQVSMAKAHWSRIFDFVMPDLLPIMASLSDGQVDQILAQLKKEQQELIEEYAGKDQAELIKDSDKRIAEQLSEWTGDATDEQKNIIHQANTQRLATLDMWLEYRHEWLSQFEQALKRRQQTDYFTQQMKLLMISPDELKSKVYRDNVTENTRKFGSMLITLNQTFSQKQRKHFDKKLAELVEDLTELHLDK
jgi:vacuolar-type H+-ATPase subunit H